jgi:hypothetical protein
MAPLRAGTPGAGACNAGRRTRRLKKHSAGPGRIKGFLLEARQQLLDAIYAGRAFRSVLRDLNLTPNQVWGMARVDREWSAALEAALTATRRDDLKHGTNAAYVAGCVCSECRGHQRVRVAKQRLSAVS